MRLLIVGTPCWVERLGRIAVGVGAFALLGCADGPSLDNLDDLAGVDSSGVRDSEEIDQLLGECRPNLDGQIDAEELAPVVGVPAVWGVRGPGVMVDTVGETVDGALRWDFSSSDSTERTYDFAAEALTGKWYADAFPADGFVVDVDAAGTTEAVYTHTDQALLLYGLASAEEAPANGQTLLVYDAPVEVLRFPLREGDSWIAVGTVTGGTALGLPYAGRDTYTVDIDGSGVIELEFLSFEQALRVRTHLSIQPSVGIPVSRHQVSWYFECFGEVARATSENDEASSEFTIASELRRLSL